MSSCRRRSSSYPFGNNAVLYGGGIAKNLLQHLLVWSCLVSCIPGMLMVAIAEEDTTTSSPDNTTSADTAASQVSLPCTMCLDGSEPYGELVAGDPNSCVEFDNLISSFDYDSKTCKDAQMEGYLKCSCPTWPEESYCTMCGDGIFDIQNPLLGFPILLDGACEDYIYKYINDVAECNSIANAAYYCGCPNAVRSDCYLCKQFETADGTTSIDSAIIIPPEYNDRLVPPTFEFGCKDWDDAASLFTASTCNQLTQDIPLDLPAYCGCPLDVYVDDPITVNGCSLCPDNTNHPLVTDADTRLVASPTTNEDGMSPRTSSSSSSYPSTMTCADVHNFMMYVTDETYCSEVQIELQSICCEDIEAIPTFQPSTMEPNNDSNDSNDGGRDNESSLEGNDDSSCPTVLIGYGRILLAIIIVVSFSV